MILCDGGCGTELESIRIKTPERMRCYECTRYRNFWADQLLDCLTLCKRYFEKQREDYYNKNKCDPDAKDCYIIRMEESSIKHLDHCKSNDKDCPYR